MTSSKVRTRNLAVKKPGTGSCTLGLLLILWLLLLDTYSVLRIGFPVFGDNLCWEYALWFIDEFLGPDW